MLKRILVVLALISPLDARAAGECRSLLIFADDGTSFSAEDISSGTATTDIFAVTTGANLLMRFDMTDASNDISNVRLTFREYSSNTNSPQARTVLDCDKNAGIWTCDQLKIDYDPTTSGNGKNWVMPIPLAYKYMDMTVTTTGHGAGDTLTLGAEVCY